MSAPLAILDVGPCALLAEFVALDEVVSAAAALRADPPPGVVDIVPAMRTVLVTFAGPRHVDRAALTRICSGAERMPKVASASAVTIAVRYDGLDLASVADAGGLSVEDVVRRHQAASYTVAFCGFQPGFAYLTGLDPALHLPRLAEPRSRVDAGSVAVASEFSAVYPSAGPGGWHLLGHTDVVLWDEGAEQPALLPPGTIVRFESQ